MHFTDPVYYLDSHSILLKIYWEEGEDEAIRSLHETVRIYLLRQRSLNNNRYSCTGSCSGSHSDCSGCAIHLLIYQQLNNNASTARSEPTWIFRKRWPTGLAAGSVEATGGFLKITPSDNEPTEEVE